MCSAGSQVTRSPGNTGCRGQPARVPTQPRSMALGRSGRRVTSSPAVPSLFHCPVFEHLKNRTPDSLGTCKPHTEEPASGPLAMPRSQACWKTDEQIGGDVLLLGERR